MKKIKRPKLKFKRLVGRKKGAYVQTQATDEGVPRITTETIAAHREQVIGNARKYIPPMMKWRPCLSLVLF